MKKILAMALALCMIFALCACGAKTEAPAAEAPAQQAPAEAAAPAADTYQMSVSTGGVTGMYYTTLAPICDLINSSTDKIRIVPATSGGSTENFLTISKANL